MVPNVAHFVFGLDEQSEPFHFLHYLAIESCRRVIRPDVIYFHHRYQPWGEWWDRIAPHLTLVQANLAQEVLDADYSSGRVPSRYLYAHHADFVRLDALIEYGGIYVDIDTVFVRPLDRRLFGHRFVIASEGLVRDELLGEGRPSLCNALMMSEQGSLFASTWRRRMPDALNGTWSNHSGFLAQTLSEEMPEQVHIEPKSTFYPFSASIEGLRQLLSESSQVPPESSSVHMWAHLWWRRNRRDFTDAHAGWCTPTVIRRTSTTFAELARPYLDGDAGHAAHSPARESVAEQDRWRYLSLDEHSGYAIAANRCMDALEAAGQELSWTPFVPGPGWNLGYQPAIAPKFAGDQVVVAHLTPEYLPELRRRAPDAFLVSHTAWETDSAPSSWKPCFAAADLIVVPSSFSAAAIQQQSLVTPIAVVPHVAAPVARSETNAWSSLTHGRFVFYTIGEWTERKAVFLTVEAYLRSFVSSDPVLLVVKTSYLDRRLPPPRDLSRTKKGTTAFSLAKLLARFPNSAPVVLVTRELTNDEVAALHQRGDCFVSLSRGEGWGLGAFDAAGAGNPVVATGYGGQLEFLDGSPYLVDFNLVQVDSPRGFPSYAPDQRWADPDIDHAVSLLREVYAKGDEATTADSSAADAIRQKYSPEIVGASFVAAVTAHRATREVSGAGSPAKPR